MARHRAQRPVLGSPGPARVPDAGTRWTCYDVEDWADPDGLASRGPGAWPNPSSSLYSRGWPAMDSSRAPRDQAYGAEAPDPDQWASWGPDGQGAENPADGTDGRHGPGPRGLARPGPCGLGGPGPCGLGGPGPCGRGEPGSCGLGGPGALRTGRARALRTGRARALRTGRARALRTGRARGPGTERARDLGTEARVLRTGRARSPGRGEPGTCGRRPGYSNGQELGTARNLHGQELNGQELDGQELNGQEPGSQEPDGPDAAATGRTEGARVYVLGESRRRGR